MDFDVDPWMGFGSGNGDNTTYESRKDNTGVKGYSLGEFNKLNFDRTDRIKDWINFSSRRRAIEYLQQKIDKGLPNAIAKTFEVPRSFLRELNKMAVNELDIKLKDPHKVKPMIADPTKVKNQIGLRKAQQKKLKELLIQGAEKMENNYQTSYQQRYTDYL